MLVLYRDEKYTQSQNYIALKEAEMQKLCVKPDVWLYFRLQ